MSERDNKTHRFYTNATYSASTETKALTVNDLKKTMEELDPTKHIKKMANIFGMKIFCDESGMLVGPNEYMLCVGTKLYKKLKDL